MTSNAISIKINRIFKTPRQIQQGLMFLKNIPRKSGALFCMSQKKVHKFWMKNTYVSLDLIFLDENFIIVGLIENAKPLDLSLIHVDHPSKYIIEINSGFINEKNLQLGNSVKLIYKKNPSKKKNITNRNKSISAKNRNII